MLETLILLPFLWLPKVASFSVRPISVIAGTPGITQYPSSLLVHLEMVKAGSSPSAEIYDGNDDYDDDDDVTTKTNMLGLEGIVEGLVREITGEAEYQFGDLGDKNNVTHHGETTANNWYQLEDITKSIVTRITNHNSYSSSSNNNSKNRNKVTQRLPEFLQWQNSLREKDLPLELLETIFHRLDKNQRINLVLTMCQLAAEAVVLWGLVTNLCTLVTAAVSWILTLHAVQPTLPSLGIPMLHHVDKELWRTFVAKYIGLDFILSPFFLIAKAMILLVGFRKFHSFVHALSTTSWVTQGHLQKFHSPVLNKAVAVILAFFLANIIGSALSTALLFNLINFCFRVGR